jgi:hypothetical protein
VQVKLDILVAGGGAVGLVALAKAIASHIDLAAK